MRTTNNTERMARVAVEWSFGQVVEMFRYLTVKRAQLVRLTRPGLMYAVAVLLYNSRVCLRGGGPAATYFNLPPPTIDEYFA